MTGASAACRIVPKNGEGTAGISTCANLAIVRHTRKNWGEKMKWPPFYALRKLRRPPGDLQATLF